MFKRNKRKKKGKEKGGKVQVLESLGSIFRSLKRTDTGVAKKIRFFSSPIVIEQNNKKKKE